MIARLRAPAAWFFLVVLVSSSLLSSAATAAKPEREQVVIGGIALPSRGVATNQVEACDPRARGSLDRIRREKKIENGSIAYWFEVDARTYGDGFVLEPTGGEGPVDLDIVFMAPAVTSYTTTVEGGERGQVPPESDWAVVCMTTGLNASFRYRAGPSTPIVDVREEASWSDHSANLRLLGRHFTADSPRRIVFQGRHAITASVHGINIFRLRQKSPYLEHISYFECGAGVTADLSVWGDYVFQSVPNEYPYFATWPTAEYNGGQSDRCNNTDRSHGKAGIRVIDISEPKKPRQVKFFETPCGAMNHTLMPHRGALYIYAPIPCDEDTEVRIPAVDPPEPSPVPSSGPVTPEREIRPLNFQIRVIRFEPKDPARSRVVGTPPLGDAGEQLGCHDITVFPSRNLAACPQFFNEVMHTSLLDISDPLNPQVIKQLAVPSESTWMAYATFTWDGRYLVLADTDGADYAHHRLGDCEGDDDRRGALWIYDVGDPSEAVLVSRFALPRAVVSVDHACGPTEVSMIPTRDVGRRVAVVGWNGGGMTVVDLSEPTAPREIGHWLPPVASEIKGSYFYNGRIYSTEWWTGPGVRVFDLAGFGPQETRTYATRMNPQTQVIDFRK